MFTTTFHYIVETDPGTFRYISFNITHDQFDNYEEDYKKTHEEIGPLFLSRQFNVSEENITPITKEQYDMIPD